jgi:hypothetical protein
VTPEGKVEPIIEAPPEVKDRFGGMVRNPHGVY